MIDLEDANGVKILQELIAVAAEGGGYVEYLWPDPAGRRGRRNRLA